MTESMDVSETQQKQPNIFAKLSDIPVVNSSYNGFWSVYNKTKEYSLVTRYALGMAEMSLAVVTTSAKPVVNKLEKPISAANDFACQSLDSLEEAYPIILKPTDKVLDSVKGEALQVWENTKLKGVSRMEGLKDTPIARVVNSGVDMALTISEYAVENYLPEEPENVGEGEGEGAVAGDDGISQEKSALGRVTVLGGKVRRRLLSVAMKKIQHAQMRTQESLDNLKHTVNLLDYAKNLDCSQIQDRASDAKTKLWDTWNEWTTEEEGEGCPEDQEKEEGTMAVFRDLSKRLKIATSKLAAVSASYLPQNIMNSINKAKSSANSLYQTIANLKLEGLKELPGSWLDIIKGKLSDVSKMLNQLTDYLTSSKFLNWLMTSSHLKALSPKWTKLELDSVPCEESATFIFKEDDKSDEDKPHME